MNHLVWILSANDGGQLYAYPPKLNSQKEMLLPETPLLPSYKKFKKKTELQFWILQTLHFLNTSWNVLFSS